MGGWGELPDPPIQNLEKPRDPELSHPTGGGGGLDSQPPTDPASQPPKQYTRNEHWTSFQKFQEFLKHMTSLLIVITV